MSHVKNRAKGALNKESLSSQVLEVFMKELAKQGDGETQVLHPFSVGKNEEEGPCIITCLWVYLGLFPSLIFSVIVHHLGIKYNSLLGKSRMWCAYKNRWLYTYWLRDIWEMKAKVKEGDTLRTRASKECGGKVGRSLAELIPFDSCEI